MVFEIKLNLYAIFTYIPRLAFSMIRFDVVIDIITFMILLSSLGLCSFFWVLEGVKDSSGFLLMNWPVHFKGGVFCQDESRLSG